MPKIAEVNLKGKRIQFVILRLGKEEFGLPIHSVLEISRMLDITHIPQAPGFIEGVANLRGQIITVIGLARQFQLMEKPLTKSSRIVVVEMGQEKIGLIVDEVPEVLKLYEADIDSAPDLIQTDIGKNYISGVAKLGERLIILLDIDRVLDSREMNLAQKIGREAAHGEHPNC
jgi:purine-binding chemotaxis protein CheW